MQGLVAIRRSLCESEEQVKTEIKGTMTGWRGKKRKLRYKLLKNPKEPRYATSGRGPSSKVYREAGANGSVPGDRGPRKGNGSRPNGAPGGSAGHPPARPPRAASLRPAPGRGRRRSAAAGGHFPSAALSPAFVRRALRTHATAVAHSKPGAESKRRPTRKRRLRRFSSKQTLLGRRGRPVRAARFPARPPRPGPPRSLGPPAPAVPGATRTAHQLPRRRLQRRRPGLECGRGLRRRVLLLLHRGGREPRDERRRRTDVTRREPASARGGRRACPNPGGAQESGRGLSGEPADRLAEEEEREGERASRSEAGRAGPARKSREVELERSVAAAAAATARSGLGVRSWYLCGRRRRRRRKGVEERRPGGREEARPEREAEAR